jgi:hypothetical protein
MTRIPHFNFPAFHDAAADLRRRGYSVTSPAELDSPAAKQAAEESPDGDPSHYAHGETWGDLLARDVKLIADGGIEAIVVLPGWEKSRGGRLETFVGRLCGLPILQYPTLTAALPDDVNIAHAHESLVEEYEEEAEWDGEPQNMKWVPDDIFSDEHRIVDSLTGGAKGQKLPQFGALDPEALLELARVAGFGALKYERMNYMKGFAWSLSYDALQRHVHEFWAGREFDEESGLPHMAHAGWQCMCLVSFASRGLGTDDRISAGGHQVGRRRVSATKDEDRAR